MHVAQDDSPRYRSPAVPTVNPRRNIREWLVLLTFAALACAPLAAQTAAPEFERVAGEINPADYQASRLLVVHYHRPDGDYAGWNIWAWPEGAEGGPYAFGDQMEFGRYAVIPIRDDAIVRIGIIVRKGDWEAKDVGGDRFITLNADGPTEAWLVSGDERVFSDTTKIDLSLRLVGAFLDAPDRITLGVTAMLNKSQLAGVKIRCNSDDAKYAVTQIKRRQEPVGGRLVYDITLNRPVADQHIAALQLEIADLDSTTIYARDVLNSPQFVALDAELGPQYTPEATTFRTWSPVADSVHVVLTTPSRKRIEMVPMQRGEHGVWERTVSGDLHRVQYAYQFVSYGKKRRAPDIHCRAATLDSRTSVIVDLDRTNPEGWGSIPAPKLRHTTDEIIYEIHVRDFSIHDESCPEAHRGTYLGLIHKNPGTPESPATGLSHLSELGVTAVHLLPVADYPGAPDEYNWGYWTSLFNVPESNYATDPADPLAASRELKTAIQGLHQAGIRVILDMVYNHTSSSFEDSAFDQAVPYYYFRSTPDGGLRNDAGVGNSIADERPMVRKYILDSLGHWLTEYDVDGFRFDLVGTHQPETVQAIVLTLRKLRPDVTLYGEPWTGGGPIYFGKGAQRGMPFAVFNDHLRNAIRGDLDGTAAGFATGPGTEAFGVVEGVRGGIDDFAQEPTESVSYVSAHDNLTLWDKIAKANPDAGDATRRKMQKLALGIVLTSQGIAFLHGGSDFCRTKNGDRNTYNAGDELNAFDWPRKNEYRDVFDYVAGLVRMRRAHPAFRMHDDEAIRRNVSLLQTNPVVAFRINGEAVGDEWATVVVAYNGSDADQPLELPEGHWTQVANAYSAGEAPLAGAEGTVELPAYSMGVWIR